MKQNQDLYIITDFMQDATQSYNLLENRPEQVIILAGGEQVLVEMDDKVRRMVFPEYAIQRKYRVEPFDAKVWKALSSSLNLNTKNSSSPEYYTNTFIQKLHQRKRINFRNKCLFFGAAAAGIAAITYGAVFSPALAPVRQVMMSLLTAQMTPYVLIIALVAVIAAVLVRRHFARQEPARQESALNMGFGSR